MPYKSYQVYITETRKILVEVEANSPDEADTIAWEALQGNDECECITTLDGDSSIEYMEDEAGDTFYPNRHGGYDKRK